MKVAFQGERGAYSEGASIQYFERQGKTVEPVPCSSFEAAFEVLERGDVDRAVLPIENSLAGSIHRNYDLLLRHANVHIVGEINYRVHHNLLALPGVRLEEVQRVLSHPQALAQCEGFLTRMNLTREATYDTAGSAKRLREENLRDAAETTHAFSCWRVNPPRPRRAFLPKRPLCFRSKMRRASCSRRFRFSPCAT